MGLSDFQKLVFSILKIYLSNNQAKFIPYIDYKVKKLGPLTKNTKLIHNVFIQVLERYVPEKQKYIRTNQANFKILS